MYAWASRRKQFKLLCVGHPTPTIWCVCIYQTDEKLKFIIFYLFKNSSFSFLNNFLLTLVLHESGRRNLHSTLISRHDLEAKRVHYYSVLHFCTIWFIIDYTQVKMILYVFFITLILTYLHFYSNHRKIYRCPDSFFLFQWHHKKHTSAIKTYKLQF